MVESGDQEGAAYAALFTKNATSSRNYQLNLRRFFPSDDEFATCIARLCILREDLFFEVNGIVAGPYEWLDKNGTAWRRNYFFRNSVRTLGEIASAIHRLNCVPEFQRALEKSGQKKTKISTRIFAKRLRVPGSW